MQIRSEKDGTRDRCNAKKRDHIWTLNIAYLLVPQNKLIRPLPRKIPSQLNFIICRHIKESRRCDYSAGNCQFAHSEEEIEVWKWMVRNKCEYGICYLLMLAVVMMITDNNEAELGLS